MTHRIAATFHAILFVLFCVLGAPSVLAGEDGWQMAEERLIRQTLHKYAMFIDDRRVDDWLNLFEENAVFHVIGQDYVGREQIRDGILGKPVRPADAKHLPFPAVIELQSPTVALAWSDFLVTGNGNEDSPPVVRFIGRYHDKLVKGDDGRWRFASRHIAVGGQENKAGFVQPAP